MSLSELKSIVWSAAGGGPRPELASAPAEGQPPAAAGTSPVPGSPADGLEDETANVSTQLGACEERREGGDAPDGPSLSWLDGSVRGWPILSASTNNQSEPERLRPVKTRLPVSSACVEQAYRGTEDSLDVFELGSWVLLVFGAGAVSVLAEQVGEGEREVVGLRRHTLAFGQRPSCRHASGIRRDE